MRAFALLALAILALATAGCSTPSATNATSSDADQSAARGETSGTTTTQKGGQPPSGSTTTTTTSSSARPSSGSATVPPSSSPPGTTLEPEPPVPTVSVDEAGRLGNGVGAAGSVANYGSDRWFRQDVEGIVVGANLTMTWTAEPASQTALRLTFTPIEVSDGGGESYTGDTRFIEGESPLTLDLKDLDWDYETYAVTAWWAGTVHHTPLGQDFRISGTISYKE